LLITDFPLSYPRCTQATFLKKGSVAPFKIVAPYYQKAIEITLILTGVFGQLTQLLGNLLLLGKAAA
jgi:hypothetical protein